MRMRMNLLDEIKCIRMLSELRDSIQIEAIENCQKFGFGREVKDYVSKTVDMLLVDIIRKNFKINSESEVYELLAVVRE